MVAVGVLQVGAAAFAALMMAAGDSADHAHEMFDASVAIVFGVAALVAALLAVAVAMLLARRLARPLERVADAARRLADGELGVRVPEEGPAELRDLAAAYNAMADRLAEQELVRREFIVNASHELRTPLTNLQGYLEALRDGVLPPDPATFDSLREEVDRLDAARVVARRAGRRRDRARRGRGRRRRGDRARLGRPRGAGPRPAVDHARSSTRSPGCSSAPARDELTQVLANLLQNAVRYTPSGGEVRVSAARADDGVRVTVANTGPGIPPDDLPRVWERFYRVEKSRDRARGGAGIGLAIVRQLVEDAGGRVGASSEDGWTTFWLTLPAGA